MKAKTKFTKMYYKLPEEARIELIYNWAAGNPMTLSVCMMEIRNDTEIGKNILTKLGYADD